MNKAINFPTIRRSRTWFSPDQLNILEQAFLTNTYPNAQQRELLSKKTQLSEAKIQVLRLI